MYSQGTTKGRYQLCNILWSEGHKQDLVDVSTWTHPLPSNTNLMIVDSAICKVL